MALSTPPPPPSNNASPPSAPVTTTTAAAAPPRPPFPPNPRVAHPPPIYNTGPFYPPHMMHQLNSRQHAPPHDATTPAATPPNPAVLYPVASSGRGFLKKQAPLSHPNPNSRPLFGYPQSDPGQPPPGQSPFLTPRPTTTTYLQQQQQHMPGVPVASAHAQRKMIASPNSNADSNGHRDARERSKGDSSLELVRDRKVRMSESASLYSLCRSWLRNGPPEESQPVYMHGAQSLPKPLPAKKVDAEEEVKEEEIQKELAEVTFQELLRAKFDGSETVHRKPKSEKKPTGREIKNRWCGILVESLSTAQVDVDGFRRRYRFLYQNDFPAKKEDLKKQLQKADDPEVIDGLKSRIAWLDKQLKSAASKLTEQRILAQHKKKEREAAKQGKMPFYLKKSEIRKLKLKGKYNELKSSGKLESFIEKRRKKNASKDHRYVP